MAEIASQQTQAVKVAKRREYGLNEHPNMLFKLSLISSGIIETLFHFLVECYMYAKYTCVMCVCAHVCASYGMCVCVFVCTYVYVYMYLFLPHHTA